MAQRLRRDIGFFGATAWVVGGVVGKGLNVLIAGVALLSALWLSLRKRALDNADPDYLARFASSGADGSQS